MRGIALDLQAELRANTPRDTGYTAENWHVTTGAPVGEPTGRLGSRSGASAARAAVRQERAEVADYRLGQGPVFVTNPTVNAERLNEGSSTQEPAAFVERAIAKAVRAR